RWVTPRIRRSASAAQPFPSAALISLMSGCLPESGGRRQDRTPDSAGRSRYWTQRGTAQVNSNPSAGGRIVFLIIGLIVVFGSVLAGYVLHHGNVLVLWQWTEFIIIGGAGIGAYIVG